MNNAKPEKKFYPRPLWFWNDKPTADGIRDLMRNCVKKDGYAGFGILPYDACGLEYMGDEYLSLYRAVLEEAEKLKINICLYDEWWFPSGWAGGILKEKYPEACAKRLDLDETELVAGENKVKLPTDGVIMAAVAVRGEERIDLANGIADGYAVWDAPDEGWKLQCFVLRQTEWNHVDYLSPDAVKKFIEVTHEAYYRAFKKYFGTVIDSVFYDEPQFYGADGRMWTEGINRRFEEKYGESPARYYPALFYDIGEDTCFARNALLSVRAELYAEGFPKVVQEWCDSHGVMLTGHVDQEEVENPCGMTGDLMFSFRYQDIPGVDEIVTEKRGSRAYKIVSSAAVNWGKRLVMTECFGAMENLTEEGMYRESYDLFTKGINFIVPHAVWYSADPEKVFFRPELSYRDAVYGKILPAYCEYSARVSQALQGGGQVNSVAVLYPIESLQSEYTLNWGGNPYFGGPTWEHNDYMALGQYLIRDLNCDFTFLHPQAVKEYCKVENGALVLESDVHFQRYNVVIMPGMKAISLYTLNVLKEFVGQGGTLISVTELPVKGSEKGSSAEIRKTVLDLFGRDLTGTESAVKRFGKGKCVSVPHDGYSALAKYLSEVTLDTRVKIPVSGLQWIRKRNADFDVWYFAATEKPVNTDVEIEGKWQCTAVSPTDGKETPLPCRQTEDVTRISLSLGKEKSLLVFGKEL